MCTEYSCFKVYLDTATSIQDKISKIDQIMAALLDAALDGAGTSNTDEYMLDDGQSKIKQVYRSVDDIMKSYFDLEKIRIMLAQRINGRSVILRDKNSNLFC